MPVDKRGAKRVGLARGNAKSYGTCRCRRANEIREWMCRGSMARPDGTRRRPCGWIGTGSKSIRNGLARKIRFI